jgi:class 3 adenylate cyclase/tetratricopeptide (TPR) repeat protein
VVVAVSTRAVSTAIGLARAAAVSGKRSDLPIADRTAGSYGARRAYDYAQVDPAEDQPPLSPDEILPARLRIFLNYRRQDSAGHAGRLFDALVQCFGDEQVFMDVDRLALGRDFVEAIDREVGSCDVMIALIGRNWLSVADADGRPRLEDPSDYVRLEIEAALTRDVPVIPALVQDAEMPRSVELPDSLAPLAHRQGLPIRDIGWHEDVARLMRALERIAEEKEAGAQAQQELRGPAQRERAERGRVETDAGRRDRKLATARGAPPPPQERSAGTGAAAPAERGVADRGMRARAGDAIEETSVVSSSPTSAPPRAAVRKTVTVVFCELMAANGAGEELDAESLAHVTARCYEELSRVLEHHGGSVQSYLGDAVLAFFGIPNIHEDDALRAIRAADEARGAVARLNEELQAGWGVTLQMGTGVNSGEVMAGERSRSGSFVAGQVAKIAARLAQAASPGEILLGGATYRLVRDVVEADSAEPLSVPWRRVPLPAFKLTEVAARVAGLARRLDSPMIGRARELVLLQEAFEQAVQTRGCQLATVVGAAGLGKSRLTHELVSSLRDRARVLKGRCLPYGEGITFWPVGEIVKEAAGVGQADSRHEARSKIAALVPHNEDAEAIVERVAGAIGLSEAAAQPEETFWAVRKLLEALAAERPLVVVLDDVHWGEATFFDLVQHLAGYSRQAAILLVCVARSELRDEQPSLASAGVSLGLEPLDPSQTETLIENLLGDAELPKEASRQIAKAAGGNPLFVEEMLHMLVDDGLLRRENGSWRPAGDLSNVTVPPTIRALLGARLDRLRNAERAVLERAAVIGEEFWRGAVRELSPDAARSELGYFLDTLVRKELVHPGGRSLGGEEAFRFAHILIRDVAYQALLKQTRAELHERFATWLEQRAGERVAEYEEILGYHLEQAYRYHEAAGGVDARSRRLARRAADRLVSAGARTFTRFDMPATVHLYERAVALLPEQDPAQLALLPDLAYALRETGRLPEADRVVTEAIEVARSVGDRRLEFHAAIERAFGQLWTDPELATDDLISLVERAIPIFEELHDESGLARAWHLRGEAHVNSCQCGASIAAFEQALVHARRAGDRRLEAHLVSLIAASHYWGPTPVHEAVRRNEEIVNHAQGHHVVTSTVCLALAGLRAMDGCFKEARVLYARGRALAEELGQKQAVASVPLYASQVELLAGNAAAAERELRTGYESLADMGDTGVLSTVAAFLAEALYALGRYDEAERFTRASEEAASPDDVLSQAGWRGVQGKLLARRGKPEEALAIARESVSLATPTDYLDLRGKAAMDLAEVLELTGASGEALPIIEEAVELYEAKQNRVAAGQARRRLKELTEA